MTEGHGRVMDTGITEGHGRVMVSILDLQSRETWDQFLPAPDQFFMLHYLQLT